LLYVVVPFVLIQFVPVEKTNPTFEKANELIAPPNVKSILKTSCYDCHSNETTWPFYSYIAPISWIVARDVSLGREELNFSEWNKLDNDKKNHKKEEIVEEISLDSMPVPIYLITHPSAMLSNEEKIILKHWATGRTTD
jgi:hypothetical protein